MCCCVYRSLWRISNLLTNIHTRCSSSSCSHIRRSFYLFTNSTCVRFRLMFVRFTRFFGGFSLACTALGVLFVSFLLTKLLKLLSPSSEWIPTVLLLVHSIHSQWLLTGSTPSLDHHGLYLLRSVEQESNCSSRR